MLVKLYSYQNDKWDDRPTEILTSNPITRAGRSLCVKCPSIYVARGFLNKWWINIRDIGCACSFANRRLNYQFGIGLRPFTVVDT